MKVKDLQKELQKLIEEGHGEYDVMIKVGEHDRDLITNISDIRAFGKNAVYEIGYIELDSCNHVNW